MIDYLPSMALRRWISRILYSLGVRTEPVRYYVWRSKQPFKPLKPGQMLDFANPQPDRRDIH